MCCASSASSGAATPTRMVLIAGCESANRVAASVSDDWNGAVYRVTYGGGPVARR
jgi:hypothetical protein